MAAPHVAGSAALMLELEPTATPARVRELLWSRLTANVIRNAGIATNPHLLSLLDPAGRPPAESPRTDAILVQATSYKYSGSWQVVVEAFGVKTDAANVYRDGQLIGRITWSTLGWRYLDQLSIKGKLPPYRYTVCDSDGARCSAPTGVAR